MCLIWHLQGGDGVLLLQHKRGVCRPMALYQLPGRILWPWGTDAHYWSWSWSVSSLCEYSVSPSIAWLCCIFLGNSDTKMQWAEAFRLLVLVTGNRCHLFNILHSDTLRILFLSTLKTAQWVAEPGSNSTDKSYQPLQWQLRLPFVMGTRPMPWHLSVLSHPLPPPSPKNLYLKPKKPPPGFSYTYWLLSHILASLFCSWGLQGSAQAS